jgi:hypothetical protein
MDDRKTREDQFRALKRAGSVICPCAREIPVRFAYRCFDCRVWFCEPCTAAHFGRDRMPKESDDE